MCPFIVILTAIEKDARNYFFPRYAGRNGTNAILNGGRKQHATDLSLR